MLVLIFHILKNHIMYDKDNKPNNTLDNIKNFQFILYKPRMV